MTVQQNSLSLQKTLAHPFLCGSCCSIFSFLCNYVFIFACFCVHVFVGRYIVGPSSISSSDYAFGIFNFSLQNLKRRASCHGIYYFAKEARRHQRDNPNLYIKIRNDFQDKICKKQRIVLIYNKSINRSKMQNRYAQHKYTHLLTFPGYNHFNKKLLKETRLMDSNLTFQ